MAIVGAVKNVQINKDIYTASVIDHETQNIIFLEVMGLYGNHFRNTLQYSPYI